MNAMYREIHSLDQLVLIDSIRQSNDLALRDALFLVTQVVNHGFPKADVYIGELAKKSSEFGVLKYLKRLKKRHLAIQSLPRLKDTLADEDIVNELYKTNGFCFRPGNVNYNTVVVIFTTIFNNYEFSNLVLDAIFSDLGVSRLFLKDTSTYSYFKGVKGLTNDLFTLPTTLEQFLKERNIKNTIITGFSSGGFSSLYTSLKLQNSGYIGYAINTKLSFGPHFKKSNLSPGIKNEFQSDLFLDLIELAKNRKFLSLRELAKKRKFLDLRELVRKRQNMSKINLYYGETNPTDRSHAIHLAGCKNVKIKGILNCGHHVTSHLLEEGLFCDPYVKLLQDIKGS